MRGCGGLVFGVVAGQILLLATELQQLAPFHCAKVRVRRAAEVYLAAQQMPA